LGTCLCGNNTSCQKQARKPTSICFNTLKKSAKLELSNHHEAEDAFQTTFLVLVRKASSVVPREMIARWLYGVAYHAALKARRNLARRSARERQVLAMPEPRHPKEASWADLQPVLDQELARLPHKYGALIILCDLHGTTRKDAARELGWPEGTVAGRLVRARAMLAKRLARHGPILSGGALAVLLSQNAMSAAVPISLTASTIKAAGVFAAGNVAVESISRTAVALTEGMLKTMLLEKLTLSISAGFVAVLGLIGMAATIATLAPEPTHAAVAGAVPTPKRPQPEAPVQASKTDKELLQGTWVRVKEELNGEKRPDDYLRSVKWVAEFTGEKFLFQWIEADRAKPISIQGVFAVDQGQKPRTITLTDTEKRQALGIYKIEGDKLTICSGSFKGNVRPSAFETKAGTDHFLAVFERQKVTKPAVEKEKNVPENETPADQAASQRELEKLAGTWIVVAVEVEGKADETSDTKFVFSKNKCTWTKEGAEAKEMTITVDVAKKPRTLDFDNRGRTMRGIYELDGDTLKICYRERGEERPAEFKTAAGSNLVLMELRRERQP
jgi:RNA polymerase sigma factor (sigma-70 family)